MKNVQIGDTVKATGMGAFFSQMTGGSGTGVVVHVENPEGTITDPQVQAEFDSGVIEFDYLNDGILYKDTADGEIHWLAPNDFVVID